MPGPVIVTVTRSERTGPSCDAGGCPCEWEPVVYCRQAFATLDEARAAIVARCFPRQPEQGMRPPEWDEPFAALFELPESGGSIVLPNGDVIEVEALALYDALWCQLSGDAQIAIGDGPFDAEWERAVLVAWNAEHGIGLEARA